MKFIVRHDGENIEVIVDRFGSGYRVTMGGEEHVADVVRANQFVRSLRLEDGRQFLIGEHRDGNAYTISFGDQNIPVEVFDPLTMLRKRRDDEGGAASGAIKALMPGRVVRLLVEEGARVQKGTGLLILEAMKMENEITAPGDGVVTRFAVKAGDTVDGGADLVLIGPPEA